MFEELLRSIRRTPTNEERPPGPGAIPCLRLLPLLASPSLRAMRGLSGAHTPRKGTLTRTCGVLRVRRPGYVRDVPCIDSPRRRLRASPAKRAVALLRRLRFVRRAGEGRPSAASASRSSCSRRKSWSICILTATSVSATSIDCAVHARMRRRPERASANVPSSFA